MPAIDYRPDIFSIADFSSSSVQVAQVPLGGMALSDVEVGRTVTVLAVDATATDVLKYLYDRNILPGQKIKVMEVAPMEGPLTLLVGSKEVALGLSLAEFVIVK